VNQKAIFQPSTLIVSVQAILVLIAAAFFLGSPEITPDSDSYLNWADFRSIGYPFFLDLVEAVNPNLVLLGPFQFLLIGVSAIFFARQVAVTLKSEVISALVFIIICFNPFTLTFVPQVMTEALYTAFTTTILAAGLLFLRRPTLGCLLLMATIVFLLMLVRPIGVTFIVLLIGLPIISFRFQRSQRSQNAKPSLVVASFVTTLLLVVAYMMTSERPIESMSLLDRHLFAKGALVSANNGPAPEEGSLRHRIWLETETFADVREVIANAPNDAVKFFIQRHYEVFVQWKIPSALWVDDGALSFNEFGQIAASVGVDRMRSAPKETLELIWLHYWSLWTPFAYDAKPAIGKEYLNSVELPIVEVRERLLAPRGFRFFAPAAVLLMKTVWALTLLTLLWSLVHFALPGRKSENLLLSGVLALFLHVTLLLVAITALGIARYTFALSPVFALWAGAAVCAVRDSFSVRTTTR
jgi:hypothetical protein